MVNTTDKVVIGTTTTSGALAATGWVSTLIGFTSSGIGAGTMAAGMQAGVGNVVAGSAFAGMQSLGATGVFFGLGAVGGVGLVAGGVYGGVKLYQHLKNKKPNPKL